MQMNKNIIPTYCMCLTNRQGAETDQNIPFSPRGAAGRFRSSHSLTTGQEPHREVLGALRYPSFAQRNVWLNRLLLRIYLWVCRQVEEGCSGQSQPCLPRGWGPCCWRRLLGRAQDFGVPGHDGAAGCSAAGIPCIGGGEGGTDRHR